MATTISKRQVKLNQGQDGNGNTFGYIEGDEGGFFFTWLETLDATLASVDVDAVDGDGDLDESEVVEFLRDCLPRTALGRAMWSV